MIKIDMRNQSYHMYFNSDVLLNLWIFFGNLFFHLTEILKSMPFMPTKLSCSVRSERLRCFNGIVISTVLKAINILVTDSFRRFNDF